MFGPKGEARSIEYKMGRQYSDAQIEVFVGAYADQVKFLNDRIAESIAKIVRNSKVSPVIVLQGDHGLRLFHDKDPERCCLVESFANLNALRLPGVAAERLYDTVSPINTFRLIFDTYFGTDFGLLEDRSYLQKEDVTERIESCAGVELIAGRPVRRIDP